MLTGPLLWSAGLDYLKNGNREVGFDDPRAATALGKLHTLNANGSLLLGAPADWSDPGAFIDGLTAMQWTGLWNVPKIRDAFDDDFGVLPFPKLDGSGRAVGAGRRVRRDGQRQERARRRGQGVREVAVDRQHRTTSWSSRRSSVSTSRRARAWPTARTASRSGPAADAARFVKENSHLVGGPVWTQQANTALSDAVAKIAKEGADPVAQVKTAVDASPQAELKRLFG